MDDVMTAILTRRSERRLIDPAPTTEEFAELLAVAATAPDHGLLRPWRWVLLRDADRDALGERFAAEAGPERSAEFAAKVLRAPLLATLVFQPRLGHRIPEWEQLAATSLMSHAMMLLLHSRGYGSIWRTGPHADSPGVRDLLGLDPDERTLGWLYIGSPIRDRVHPPHVPLDLKVSVATDGELTPPGFVVDFAAFDPLRQHIGSCFDHRVLNDVLDVPPTSEHLAAYVHHWCSEHLQLPAHVQVDAVRIQETAATFAEYRPARP
jgi:nitroreductase